MKIPNEVQSFVDKYYEMYPEQKAKDEKEAKKKKKSRLSSIYYKFVCQCKGGHLFDYRKRIRYDDDFHSPCQGKCPICGSSQWSNIYYPIKWNFIG